MAGKITDYTPITTLTAGDLMDWSNYDEVSAYTSNSITWANLLVNINAQASFPDTNTNIFSNDGTIGAGRIATLTDSLTFATGQVNLAASAAGYPSFNIGNGSDPSSPSDGDMWFNGTNLYFRDGAVSVDLLAGGSDTNFANTDLTLTGNRVHDLGVNELTFGTTGDAQLMRFDATNSRIGIGTSTPTEKLDVVGNVLINGVVTANTDYFKVKRGATDAFKVYNNSGGVSELLLNNDLGVTAVKLNGGNGTSATSYIDNRVHINGTTLASAEYFKITAVTGGNKSYLAVDNTNGNIFEVRTPASGYPEVILADDAGAVQTLISSRSDSYIDWNGGVGNLGIGTKTPTEKLDVVGSIKSSVGYKVGAATGVTQTGAYTNFTIVGGIITAAS